MNDQVDMSQFIEARSDQLNSDDLIGRTLTVTVTKVAGSEGDQPISIFFEGDNGKPFKPCKTIRRVLCAVWGRFANDYVGRSMTLYRDDTVQFGGLQVGGIRISHMSYLDKETIVVVAKSKGKKAGMKILPLIMERQQQAQQQTAPRVTAAQFTRAHIEAVQSAETVEALDEILADDAADLANLKKGKPELFADVELAANTRRAQLEQPGKAVEDSGESGFADDDPAPWQAKADEIRAMIANAIGPASLDQAGAELDTHEAALPDNIAEQLVEELAAKRKALA